jgi:transcriptional regulator with XRE-family HTH domain
MPPIPKPKRKRIAHFIRAWRKRRKLTQEEVAGHMGIAASTFGRVERNLVPYDQDFLELAADVLRCKPWDLLSHDPAKEGDIIDLLASLDDAERKEVEQYIRYRASLKPR